MKAPSPELALDMTPVRACWILQSNNAPPMAQRLIDSLNRWNPADMTRCQYAAVFLLHFWQLAALNSPGPVPSFVLVRPDGSEDAILREVLSLEVIPHENEVENPNTAPGTRSWAIDQMKGVIITRIREERGEKLHYPLAERMEVWNSRRIIAFGDAPRGPYAKRFYKDFGVITPADGHKTAVVHTPDDVRAMQADLAAGYDLTHPVGRNARGEPVNKESPIAGALTPKECTSKLIDWSVNHEKRLLYLPHAGVAALPMPHEREIRAACSFIHMELRSSTFPYKMERMEKLPVIPGEEEYLEFMRKRLVHLPIGYQTNILGTVSQLKTVAIRLGEWIKQPGIDVKQLGNFVCEYYLAALRGITMGVAWLAWYGLGIVARSHEGIVRRILATVRKKGSVTLRSLHRPLQRHMDSKMRDLLLVFMEHCGVVRLNGKTVSAVSYEEFLAKLPQLPDFPRPKAKVPAQ